MAEHQKHFEELIADFHGYFDNHLTILQKIEPTINIGTQIIFTKITWVTQKQICAFCKQKKCPSYV